MVWLALMIGNSRFHWAWWQGQHRQDTWHSPHHSPLGDPAIWDWPLPLRQQLGSQHWSTVPLYLASVVPHQTALWQPYAYATITLDQIPLHNLYTTLGIDRALAAYGAGEHYGYPVLAIDGGTALTLTGLDDHKQLVGGAIWPGLRLQVQSLSQGTAALPELVGDLWTSPMAHWHQDTPGAIRSGIFHSTIAGLRDFGKNWQERFPGSSIILTGGDGPALTQGLHHDLGVQFDPDLVWKGLELVVRVHHRITQARSEFSP